MILLQCKSYRLTRLKINNLNILPTASNVKFCALNVKYTGVNVKSF
jgi:hypothetical protein